MSYTEFIKNIFEQYELETEYVEYELDNLNTQIVLIRKQIKKTDDKTIKTILILKRKTLFKEIAILEERVREYLIVLRTEINDSYVLIADANCEILKNKALEYSKGSDEANKYWRSYYEMKEIYEKYDSVKYSITNAIQGFL